MKSSAVGLAVGHVESAGAGFDTDTTDGGLVPDGLRERAGTGQVAALGDIVTGETNLAETRVDHALLAELDREHPEGALAAGALDVLFPTALGDELSAGPFLTGGGTGDAGAEAEGCDAHAANEGDRGNELGSGLGELVHDELFSYGGRTLLSSGQSTKVYSGDGVFWCFTSEKNKRSSCPCRK